MTFLKRARALLSLGVTWALTWGTAGAIFMSSRVLYVEPRLPPAEYVPKFVAWAFPVFGCMGLVAGIGFGLLLLAAERRRQSISALRVRRVATWGAVGGISAVGIAASLVSLPVTTLLTGGAVMGMVGALSASGTLALARLSGPSPPTPLPDAPRFRELT